MSLVEENKRLCKISDLLDLFKEIRAILSEDTTDDYQLKFKREALQIVVLMYIHLQESMSEEEITRAGDELATLFKADREAHETDG